MHATEDPFFERLHVLTPRVLEDLPDLVPCLGILCICRKRAPPPRDARRAAAVSPAATHATGAEAVVFLTHKTIAVRFRNTLQFLFPTELHILSYTLS